MNPHPREALMKRIAAAAVVLGASHSQPEPRRARTARRRRRRRKRSSSRSGRAWTARELSVFKKVVAMYDKAHPTSRSRSSADIGDDKIIAAIRAGNAPDVVTRSSDNVGAYCVERRVDRPRAAIKPRASTSNSSRRRRATTRSTRASAARCRCSRTSAASTTTRSSSGRPASRGRRKTIPSSRPTRRS